MYAIGEGTLAIPPHWHNASVNIFSASAEGGLSVTVARDRLSLDTNLNQYAQQQIEQLPKQLAQFKLLNQQTLPLGEHHACLFDFTWQSPEMGLIHQILMCTAQGQRVLNFSGTQTGMMTLEQRQQILGILTSFSFNPSSNAALQA